MKGYTAPRRTNRDEAETVYEPQIVFALQQADGGTAVAELYSKSVET